MHNFRRAVAVQVIGMGVTVGFPELRYKLQLNYNLKYLHISATSCFSVLPIMDKYCDESIVFRTGNSGKTVVNVTWSVLAKSLL